METAEGIRYRVRHERIRRREHGLATADWSYPAEPKGGTTVVEIVSPKLDDDGEVVEVVVIAVGKANCSPRDNYNRRLGRTIALGRALKSLKNGS